MKSAAIIIGCWEEHYHNPQVRKCYDAINSFIMSSNDIETVWLSGNHVPVSGQIWYNNSYRIFFEEQGVDWIRRAWYQPKSENFANVADIIRLYHYNREQLMIWEGWQLEYLLNHTHKHIERLYYFGVGWDQGVKRDPIGWGQVCSLIEHNHIKNIQLATVKDCVLTNLQTRTKMSNYQFATPNFAKHNWQISDSLYIKQDLGWF